MVVAHSGGHTVPREAMDCTVCLIAFTRVICTPKLDVLHHQRVAGDREDTALNHFTSLPLTFVTVGDLKNSQTGLVRFLYAMALFWLSAALLARLLFFTRASRSAALFPDTEMGLGTRLRKPCDQVFKSRCVLNGTITG